MKMLSPQRFLLLVSWLFLIIIITDGEDCVHSVLVGGTITLTSQANLNAPELRWTYKTSDIFKKKKDKVSPGKEGEVTPEGYLTLKGVLAEQAGEYKAEAYDNNGQLIGNVVCVLNVFEKLVKPRVKQTCKKSSATLTCETTVSGPFTWKKTGHQKSVHVAHVHDVKLPSEGSFTCTVSNPLSNETSDPFTPDCPQAGLPSLGSDDLLWGLEWWTMVYILSAGGGVVLFLLIITCICCCRARRHAHQRQQDEGEFRLDWTHKQEDQLQDHDHPAHHHRHPPHHHHHHPPHHQPQPAGHTAPRQPRSRPRPRPQAPTPVLPTASQGEAEGDQEQPPPLPQPRRTGPRAAKGGAPGDAYAGFRA